jgi:hypothetical protein
MTRHTLELKAGHLVIKTADTAYDKPEWIVRYYPIGACNKSIADQYMYPIGAEMRETGTSSYMPNVTSDSRIFELINGGATKPLLVEAFPIEKPKCKQDTRWRNGHWEKYLKTQGWVSLHPGVCP